MDYGDSEGGYMGAQAKPRSEQMARIIDEEIRQMVDSNYQRAETILKDHIEILHNMAHALLDWETIDKFQIDELMQGRIIAPPISEIRESSIEIKRNQNREEVENDRSDQNIFALS
jgi:cell division protease FtsH